MATSSRTAQDIDNLVDWYAKHRPGVQQIHIGVPASQITKALRGRAIRQIYDKALPIVVYRGVNLVASPDDPDGIDP